MNQGSIALLVKIGVFFLAVCLIQFSQATGKCVMFDQCGSNPDQTWAQLNCVDSDPPRPVDSDSSTLLQKFCPELLAESQGKLCCSGKQINELVNNLALPEVILGKCPSCFHNFRKIFCRITCSPSQFEFLKVKDVVHNEDGRPMVKTLEAYVEASYINQTYESCREVKLDSLGGLAMDLLCGPWGSSECSPTKWFDYMGSTSNGFAPFDIIYKYVEENEDLEEIIPFNYPTIPCSEPVGENSRCSCQDCNASCSFEQPSIRKSFEELEIHRL